MEKLKIQLKKHKSEDFGVKVKYDEDEKKIVVLSVDENGIAFKAGILIGDIITKINSKGFSMIKKNWIEEINNSRPSTVSLLIERRSLLTSRFMSMSAIDKSLTSSGSGGSNNMAVLSNSSTDLQHLTDSFVDESQINEYIQPASDDAVNLSTMVMSNVNNNNSNNENNCLSKSPPMSISEIDEDCDVSIIKKSAYRQRPQQMNFGSQEPKIQRKQAVKLANSLTFNEPKIKYVLRKKTGSNNDMNKNKTFISYTNTADLNLYNSNNGNLSVKMKNSSPESSTIDGLDNQQSLVKPLSYTSINSEHSSKTHSDSLLTPLNTLKPKVEIKIFSFKDKIRKPYYTCFTLEQQSIGVLFKCLDIDNSQMSCNSTALDPRLVGLDLFMSTYATNNYCSRFLLPISMLPYCNEIIISPTINNIRINWSTYNIDFIINISKMKECDMGAVFVLLGIEAPPKKVEQVPVIKQRKPSSLPIDNIKVESKRPKIKPHPDVSKNMLSLLPRTNKIKDIPLVVVVSVAIIDKFGLKEEGLYRKSGNVGSRRVLCENVNKEDPMKWSEYSEWNNLHTVASLLKTVMSNYRLVDKDTAIRLSVIRIQNGESEDRIQSCMDMLYHFSRLFTTSTVSLNTSQNTSTSNNTVPFLSISSSSSQNQMVDEENQCRLATFVYIMKHLNRVVKYERYTKMTADSLATCWQPNLIEDLPMDEGVQFAESKKNLADTNLRKIIGFWIEHVDKLSEFMEESRVDVQYRLVREFIEKMDDPNYSMTEDDMDIFGDDIVSTTDDEFDENMIKDTIKFYTCDIMDVSIIPGFSSPQVSSLAHTPDYNQMSQSINNTRLGTNNFYQSFRSPSKKKQLNRRSSSTSPRNRRKTDPVNSDISRFKQSVDGGVKSKNILCETHFTFTDLYISGSNKNVPLFVEICIVIIEKFGLNVEGIYRKNGVQSVITELKELVINDDLTKWTYDDSLNKWSNLFVTSCLLKSLLKDMCLISFETSIHLSSALTHSSLSSNNSNNADQTRISDDELQKLLQNAVYFLSITKTDECSLVRNATLLFVLRHLSRVVSHSHNNRMNANSLAVCFAPVLMEADTDMSNMGNRFKTNALILEMLIIHIDWISDWTSVPYDKIFGPQMTNNLLTYLSSAIPFHSSSSDISLNKSSSDFCNYGDISNISNEDIANLMKPLIANSYQMKPHKSPLRRYSDNIKIQNSIIHEDDKILIERF